MKRLLSALFVLCFLFFGAASAETLTDEDLQLAVQQDYPIGRSGESKKMLLEGGRMRLPSIAK